MESLFPSIQASFRFHPHTSLFAFDTPTPFLAGQPVDPNPTTPLSAARFTAYPSSELTGTSFAWATSHLPQSSNPPLPASTFSTSSNSPIPDATSSPQTTQQSADTISKGAQIGIIVSITVVIILTLFVVGLGFLDYKRRAQRRKASKENRDSELQNLEAEIKNGRKGQKKDRDRDGRSEGLWAGLKVGHMEGDGSREETGGKDKAESNVTPAKKTDERYRGAAKGEEENVAREPLAKEPESLPAYIPRDRRSMVSEASVGVLGNPVVAMSFLEERR